jgi:Arc/MetJ family transcription regulator
LVSGGADTLAVPDLLNEYAYTEEANMRTTLDLPEKLLNDAMKITHTGTKTGVIVLALKELIRKSKIAGLKKYRGKIDLDEIRDRH